MDKLDLSQSQSPAERENFRKLDEEFQRSPILRGEWKLFDLEFSAAGTYTVKHRLGFAPLDVIQTSPFGGVTFADFNKDDISITTPGAINVRFLLGRMK